MNFNTERPWWYRHAENRSKDTWAISWTVAHSLYYYLRVNAEKNSAYTKGLEVTNKNLSTTISRLLYKLLLGRPMLMFGLPRFLQSTYYLPLKNIAKELNFVIYFSKK
jgi:hypothetical protein